MDLIEILKVVFLGIVEGITEWLPISSTGHMILADEFLRLNVSASFKEMFLVVIQLGAILAVIMIYFKKIFPFTIKNGLLIDSSIFSMWFKIIVACLPAAIVGIMWDDELNVLFYNYQTVAVMLILVGILFIVIENINKKRRQTIISIDEITYPIALTIGLFQLFAAAFPGTSRSGATILGGILLGLSRTVAAEFTFFLAIPVVLGASLLKLVKFGIDFSFSEISALIVGMVVAFLVSVFTIKFLLQYIKKHDFKLFGWYRIILGCIVLIWFGL